VESCNRRKRGSFLEVVRSEAAENQAGDSLLPGSAGLNHWSEVATALNFVFAAVPIEVTAVMQTTTISASITAYSTAVGPSSETRNLFTLAVNFDIA